MRLYPASTLELCWGRGGALNFAYKSLPIQTTGWMSRRWGWGLDTHLWPLENVRKGLTRERKTQPATDCHSGSPPCWSWRGWAQQHHHWLSTWPGRTGPGNSPTLLGDKTHIHSMFKCVSKTHTAANWRAIRTTQLDFNAAYEQWTVVTLNNRRWNWYLFIHRLYDNRGLALLRAC